MPFHPSSMPARGLRTPLDLALVRSCVAPPWLGRGDDPGSVTEPGKIRLRPRELFGGPSIQPHQRGSIRV
jgi:hypothetical protein